MHTEIDFAKMQRVAERIGVWKPEMKCPGCMDPAGHYFTGVTKDGPQGFNHEIAVPDLRPPEMVVAMLEWLIKRDSVSMSYCEPPSVVGCPWEILTNDYFFGATLADALINAIDQLPER